MTTDAIPTWNLGWSKEKTMRYSITDGELIELLQEADNRVYGPLSVSEMKEMDDMPSYKTFVKHFGTWNGAKRAAGLSENEEGMSKKNRHYAPRLYVDDEGYERFAVQEDNDSNIVGHHRLLATLDYSLEELSGNDVHHDNGVPWYNLLENLSLMSREEHTKHHHAKETTSKP